MGLSNEKVREHMSALFGESRAEELRAKLNALNPHERELVIVEELTEAFHKLNYKYVLPFRFLSDSRHRTSHHLIFVTKNFLGYNIMKGIMAKESSSATQGVASFEYNPADKRMPLLFELSRPIDELAGLLLADFEGQTISFQKLYEKHSVGKPYVERNYKDVFLQLEASGTIIANPPANQRRPGTFGEKVEITFPKSKR